VPRSEDREEAVADLVETLGDHVYSLGYRVCGNREDAEDIAQETFLSAWKAWGSFRGAASAKTWLYTIASRACWKKRRRRAGQPARFLSLRDLLPVPDTGPPPDQRIERREAAERVRGAIAHLPKIYRAPLVLKDIEDLSLSEISRVLRLGIPTVKTRIHRARLALRKEILREKRSRRNPPSACVAALRRALDLMDQGKRPAPAHLCARCRRVYRSLELVRDACSLLAGERLAPSARARILRTLQSAERAAHARPDAS
jgi:RNA polymerase sigma-70 factor, ECF subfamily